MDEMLSRVLDDLSGFVKSNFVLPDGRSVVLTSYQEDFIRKCLSRKRKRHMFIASTRVGKTTAVSVLAVLSSIFYDGEEITIVTPNFDQAMNMFKTIRHFFLSNPRLLAFARYELGFRRDEINLKNGSVLRILTAGSPEGLLGYGASVLIVDECASISDGVFRTRILRMLAGRANKPEPYIILLGTPHTKNFFYDAYVSGRYDVMKVTWKEGVREGILDKAWVEEARRMMSESEFKIWFEAEFPELGSEVFSVENVKKLAVNTKESERVDGFKYFIGLDIARMGGDESAIVVVKVSEFEESDRAVLDVVNYYSRSKQSLTEVMKWCAGLVEKWNPEAIGVDITGMGAGVYDVLREYFGNRVVAINMTGSMRTDVYTNLQTLIEEGRVRLLRDDKLVSQFSGFRLEQGKDGRYRIVKDRYGRDDLVDALAYACYAWNRGAKGRVTVLEGLMRF